MQPKLITLQVKKNRERKFLTKSDNRTVSNNHRTDGGLHKINNSDNAIVQYPRSYKRSPSGFLMFSGGYRSGALVENGLI